MNTSTSSTPSTLAAILPFEPGPFEQAPFGQTESGLAEVIEFYFAGPSTTAA